MIKETYHGDGRERYRSAASRRRYCGLSQNIGIHSGVATPHSDSLRHAILKRKTGTGSHPSGVPVPAFRARIAWSAFVIFYNSFFSILPNAALPALAADVSIIQTAQESKSAYFRRTFEINGAVRSGRVSVSQQGIHTYRLYVNGAYVGSGARCHPCDETRTDGWNVTPLLAAGNNVIAVESLNGRLALYVDIELLSGESLRVATDTEWRTLQQTERYLDSDLTSGTGGSIRTLDARFTPRVILGPVAGYADPQGIYMQFIEWFTPAYSDREWPPATVSGSVNLLPASDYFEPSRPILLDFLADIIDYGDVTPDLQFIGRKTPEICISPVQDFAAAQLFPPRYADAPFRVVTPGQSAAFIAFKNIAAEQHQQTFVRLFSTSGGEIVEAVAGGEFFCVTDLNDLMISGFSERYITRKGIQDWYLFAGGGNFLIIIRNAHEPLFIHEVGIQ